MLVSCDFIVSLLEGAPDACDDHADKVARFALGARDMIAKLPYDIRVRVGVHTGYDKASFVHLQTGP